MTILATKNHEGGHTNVSPAQGGCGQIHWYEIGPTGYPEITCPKCENFYRGDSQHSVDVAGVPETFDEKRTRESLEKRKDKQVADLTALSMAITAGDKQAEATIRQLMGQQSAVLCANRHPNPSTAKFCIKCGGKLAPAGMIECPDGHQSPAGSEFCAECGHSFAAPPAAPQAVPEPPVDAQVTISQPPAQEPPSAPAESPLPSNTKMRGMKREDLAKLAAGAGLNAEGTRAEVLDRLIAANNAKGANGA